MVDISSKFNVGDKCYFLDTTWYRRVNSYDSGFLPVYFGVINRVSVESITEGLDIKYLIGDLGATNKSIIIDRDYAEKDEDKLFLTEREAIHFQVRIFLNSIGKRASSNEDMEDIIRDVFKVCIR